MRFTFIRPILLSCALRNLAPVLASKCDKLTLLSNYLQSWILSGNSGWEKAKNDLIWGTHCGERACTHQYKIPLFIPILGKKSFIYSLRRYRVWEQTWPFNLVPRHAKLRRWLIRWEDGFRKWTWKIALVRTQIGLLQLAITWYKIRHAGGQAHYYSRTETLKQRGLNQWSLTCLFWCPSAGIIISLPSSMADFVPRYR